jgi:hypothetical protein
MAGLEAALAIAAYGGERASVEVIDPGQRFRIPATATGRAFGVGAGLDVRLPALVARTGATLRPGRLVAVDAPRHVAMLAGGQLMNLRQALGGRRRARRGPSARDADVHRPKPGYGQAEPALVAGRQGDGTLPRPFLQDLPGSVLMVDAPDPWSRAAER